MRYPYGGPGEARPSRRRARFWARATRFAAERAAPRPDDTEADRCAMLLTAGLGDAVLALDTHPAGFEDAVRKADHVEELRRVLGILLDVLADWEMLAEREARGS